MLETEQGKAQFQPTAEDLALAGLAGGAMAGLAGKRPVQKGKPSPIDSIRAEAPKPVAPMPDVEPEQLRLFDQFEERSPISKYQTEMAPDMWRVDENGIPIRADLSMEVQNLQQPLQRNLWGDELEANSLVIQTNRWTWKLVTFRVLSVSPILFIRFQAIRLVLVLSLFLISLGRIRSVRLLQYLLSKLFMFVRAVLMAVCG